jgi:hypothetical protein
MTAGVGAACVEAAVGATVGTVGVCPAGVAVEFGPPGVAVGVAVVDDPAEQPRMETLLLSIVTAPFRARALPDTMLAPLFRAMLVSARILPLNAVVVPRVAELPTCQNTLQSEPPLIMRTDELLAVVSLLPIWKMKTALLLPSASRVSSPVS